MLKSQIGFRTVIPFALILLMTTGAWSQSQVPQHTPASERLRAHDDWERMLDESRFRNVELRSVGPTIMSGRIVDIDVSPHDPTHFYVAYASGGLWRTTSNGTSFEPVADELPVITIGDIEVVWSDPEVIIVGTGENNSSRSSYSGTGLWMSDDAGSSWSHIGLDETHHIGRVIASGGSPDTLVVAAIGHLYSKNPERGVFRTVDGGKTWQHTLAIDDSTGVIDLIVDQNQTHILYASSWHRQRMAWDFVEGGATSAIYKSEDGGASWDKITGVDNGFPHGDEIGRIGLASAPTSGLLYAVVDNHGIRDERDDDEPVLTFEMLEEMDAETFLDEVSDDDLDEYLEHHGFPDHYTADSVRALIEMGEAMPADLVTYLGDANRALFDSPVIGCEVYSSSDGGASWSRTHEEYLDDTCYTYGYYFGEVWVSPHDDKEVYVAGVPLLKSVDGGANWEDVGRENVHVDHHALWLNPDRPGHIINGNDGGLNMSYDGGESWLKLNAPPVGQFYTVNVDHAQPFNVYGGLQDNGVWFGPSTYEPSTDWHGEGRYPYQRILGGDGMMVEIDPRNQDVVYAGSQFGYYSRLDLSDGSRESIRPQHELGDKPYRFNWLTPIHLSDHNADILYLGSNVVHRSMDRGDTWTAISDDLTGGGVEGNVPFGTITALVESPMSFGLLYAGSDDGRIHRSTDGGASWHRIDLQLPPNLWVSRIETSSHEEARVYVSLNGYRWDHMDPYLFVSNDFGESWTRIGENLPMGPVNVVREDPHDPDLLFVGTDRGTFVSVDRGLTFESLGSGSPPAPVHDLVVHPTEGELAIGTHGRSIFLADVTHLQVLDEALLAASLHVFAVDSLTFSEGWGNRPRAWREFSEPEVSLGFFTATGGDATIRVLDRFGNEMSAVQQSATPGLNYTILDASTCESCLRDHLADRGRDESGEDDVKTVDDTNDIEVADNGKLYLRRGSYDVEVELDGTSQRVPLHISE